MRSKDIGRSYFLYHAVKPWSWYYAKILCYEHMHLSHNKKSISLQITVLFWPCCLLALYSCGRVLLNVATSYNAAPSLFPPIPSVFACWSWQGISKELLFYSWHARLDQNFPSYIVADAPRFSTPAVNLVSWRTIIPNAPLILTRCRCLYDLNFDLDNTLLFLLCPILTPVFLNCGTIHHHQAIRYYWIRTLSRQAAQMSRETCSDSLLLIYSIWLQRTTRVAMLNFLLSRKRFSLVTIPLWRLWFILTHKILA